MTTGQDRRIGPVEASSCFVEVLLVRKKRFYEIAHNLFGLKKVFISHVKYECDECMVKTSLFGRDVCCCVAYESFGLLGLIIVTSSMAVVVDTVRLVALMRVLDGVGIVSILTLPN